MIWLVGYMIDDLIQWIIWILDNLNYGLIGNRNEMIVLLSDWIDDWFDDLLSDWIDDWFDD